MALHPTISATRITASVGMEPTGVDLGLEPARPARTAIELLAAAAAGVALGFGTQMLQGSLSDSPGVLANSGVVWAMVAFCVGLSVRPLRSAAIGGALVLVAASFSYYLAADWFEGVGFSLRTPLVWSVAGVVAGSGLGIAGFVARREPQHRSSAGALVAGLVLGEGIHLTWVVGNPQLRPAGLLELAIATAIAAVSIRHGKSAKFVPAIALATAASTLLALRLINAAFLAL
jgi:Family of unknown function (DUF6518)